MKDISPFECSVMQYFRADLLNTPMPKMRQDSEDFRNMIMAVKEKYYKKCRSSNRSEKFLKRYGELKDLYERIKEKEKDLEREGKNAHKKSFYHFRGTIRGWRKILIRLRK